MDKRRIIFIFRRGRAAELESWRRGEGPGEFLYGFPFADPKHFELSFVEGDDNSLALQRRLCLPVEKWLERRVPIGFALHIAWIHWRTLAQADAMVSTVDACGLPIGLFKRLGLFKGKLLAISQGLAHRVANLPPDQRKERFRRAYGYCLDAAERILVLSEGAKLPITTTFGITPKKIAVLPFGVDESFWTPTPADYPSAHGAIISVGSDSARDYETLLAAAAILPPDFGHQLHIVTRLIPQNLQLKGVKVTTSHTPIELRALYRNAPFVIIPLKDVNQPSGQSATLQAMACGKAVILTNTDGLWEPTYMRHGETCWLVPPADSAALVAAIKQLAANSDLAWTIGENARRLVETRYTQHYFGQGIAAHLHDLFGHLNPLTILT